MIRCLYLVTGSLRSCLSSFGVSEIIHADKA